MVVACAVEVDDAIMLMRRRRWLKARRDVRKINQRTAHISNHTFNINIFMKEECLRYFRSGCQDIDKVTGFVEWTAGRTALNRYRCHPFTVTCLMMRKLSYPVCWTDMEHILGMRASEIYEVFWTVVNSFVEANKHLPDTFRSSLVFRRAAMYAMAIHNAGSPLDNCVGFIDCTKIQMCRPGGPEANQRTCYSGHKRFHCLIFQTVTTPGGLIFYLYGPLVGRMHNITLYQISGLDDGLGDGLNVDGVRYCVYGDAAYMIRPWLQTSFQRLIADEEQAS